MKTMTSKNFQLKNILFLIYSAIKHYFENTENISLKELYCQIGNDEDMLLYVMEILRMLYNGELIVSETAEEFSKTI